MTLLAALPAATVANDTDLLLTEQSSTDKQTTRGIVRNQSVSTGLTSAGNSQGTALALTSEFNEVTTVAASSGVGLLAVSLGNYCTVANAGANTLAVYPPTGGQIDALGTNNAYSLVAGKTGNFRRSATNQWYSEGVSSSLTIQQAGTSLTQRSTLDFVGASHVAVDDAGNTRTVVYSATASEVTLLGGSL